MTETEITDLNLDIETNAVKSTGRDNKAASSCHLAVKLVEFLDLDVMALATGTR